MSNSDSLSTALSRLNDSISALDKAVEFRMKRELALSDAEAEVQRMNADRSRLAEALDLTQERANQLEHVNREVSRRLVDAMESIRTVVDRQD